MRSHLQDRDDYQKLKFDLLKKDTSHKKGNSMFKGYTLGKDAFIKNILNKAGFQGFCLRFACHHDEWETVRAFRKQYFDKLEIMDAYDFSIENPNHLHFLYYKGTEILGYINLELTSKNTARLCLLVMIEDFKSQMYEKKFKELCSLWLQKRNISLINSLNER